MALRDKRRLGRAVIEPDFSHVGPDAAEVGARRLPRPRRPRRGAAEGAAARPGRDRRASATCSPTRRCGGRGSARAAPAGELSVDELDRLRRELRAATRDAIRNGGVHTGRFMPSREKGGSCPRCGTPLARDTVGGRTTYWCPTSPGQWAYPKCPTRSGARRSPPAAIDGIPRALLRGCTPASPGEAARRPPAQAAPTAGSPDVAVAPVAGQLAATRRAARRRPAARRPRLPRPASAAARRASAPTGVRPTAASRGPSRTPTPRRSPPARRAS